LSKTRSKIARWCLILSVVAGCVSAAAAQGGSVLYGDLIVEEDGAGGLKPINYLVILYSANGYVQARQTVSPNGRYRFNNLADGEYDVVVEVENTEVARMRIQLRSPIYKTDFKHDITLVWKTTNNPPGRPGSVTPEDFYKRSPANQRMFDKARETTDKKRFDESLVLLKQLVANDTSDFQAWTELGTIFLLQKNLSEAEKAYQESIQVRPRFFLALMNLGRVRLMQQKFAEAIPIFSRAIEVRATSADANFYLGEAYLQVKKGSKAVGYFYEALKLDPVGKADAHLRLAALYNGAGLKEKAANEYAEFLKKKPDYPNRKKLEEYIARNKSTPLAGRNPDK
jgi:tetratricopeptide (TPR) repeat protein